MEGPHKYSKRVCVCVCANNDQWESETCRTRENYLLGVWPDSPAIRAVMAFSLFLLPRERVTEGIREAN